MSAEIVRRNRRTLLTDWGMESALVEWRWSLRPPQLVWTTQHRCLVTVTAPEAKGLESVFRFTIPHLRAWPRRVTHINTQLQRLWVWLPRRTCFCLILFCFVLFSPFLLYKNFKKLLYGFLVARQCPGVSARWKVGVCCMHVWSRLYTCQGIKERGERGVGGNHQSEDNSSIWMYFRLFSRGMPNTSLSVLPKK